jgi:hypothetical protein
MTPVTVLNEKAIAVEVDIKAKNFFISGDNMGNWLIGYNTIISIPEGNWEILGRPEEITEEQAKQIVKVTNGPHYGGHGPEYFPMYRVDENSEKFDTALKALKSKSISASVIILIKKQWVSIQKGRGK